MAIGDSNVIKSLDKWRLNFPISSLSLNIASSALDDLKFLGKVHVHFEAERQFLFTGIDRLPNLERGGESKTNVFLLRHTKERLFDLLLKEKILTADFNMMNGLERKRFVRITVKSHSENKLLLKALEKVSR